MNEINVPMKQLIEARETIMLFEHKHRKLIDIEELMPLLHNREKIVKEIEQELKEGYVEKFPKWLNSQDTETLCVLMATITYLDHKAREWTEFNKPKQAIIWLKTSRTFLVKAIDLWTRDFNTEDKLQLLRVATHWIEKEGGK